MRMLFLHQPIQSFLELGVCKEYLSMAKPRAPKPTNGNSAVTSTESASTVVLTAEPTVPSNGISNAPSNGTTSGNSSSAKSARKPSIMKAESRPNLFPVNLEDEVRRLAYLLSERRGFEPGHETEDWLTAEREIRLRYHQQSA